MTTVETRAISISNEFPDLFFTTTTIPQDAFKIGLETRIASIMEVNVGEAIRRVDLLNLWTSLPQEMRNEIGTGVEAFFQNDGLFLEQLLELFVSGDLAFPLYGGFSYPPIFTPHRPPGSPFHFHRLFDYLYRRKVRGASQRTPYPLTISFFVMLLSSYIDHFGTKESSRETQPFMTELLGQEIPFSHSPGLEGISLKDFLNRPLDSVCTLPFVYGVYGASQSLLHQHFLIAAEQLLAGAVGSVFAVSTFLLIQKMLSSGKLRSTIPSVSSGKKKSKKRGS